SKLEAAKSVAKSLNSDVNDLHWHTFNIDTVKFVVQMSANFSGRSVEILFEQDGFLVQGEHRLVCKLDRSDEAVSTNMSKLLDIQRNLRSVVYNVALESLTASVTYSLSKQHKGKLFLVDQGKVHWVRSPKTLEEKGLIGIDYTYLEVGDTETDIVGVDIGDANPDRRQLIHARLLGLNAQPGIELSPGSVPILEKCMYNVTYVDKFNHQKKTDTYLQGHPVSIDVVLGNSLIDEVLEHDKFCYLVSSHVIEHIPDFIQFFKSAAAVLKDGAKLVMYVPDKRYTFDVLRQISSISDIENAHNLCLRYPTREMANECYLSTDFNANAQGLWDNSYAAAPTYSECEALLVAGQKKLENADLHCFTFTPESFKGLLDYVISKYVPSLKVIEITETLYGHNEFIVDLIIRKEKS
ncbi:Methyltransferase domain-containing protein, partial [Trichlorobacter thiogenes]